MAPANNNKMISLILLIFIFYYFFFVSEKTFPKFSSGFPGLNYNPYNIWYIEKDPDSYVDKNDYTQEENNRQKTLPSSYTQRKRSPPQSGVRNPNMGSSLGLSGLPSASAPSILNTGFQNDPDGKIYHLDKHNIQCPSNKVLNSFKLTEGDGNKVRFDYNCVTGIGLNSRDRSNPDNSPAKYTKFTDARGGKLAALQDQSVTCGADGFLSNLMLQRDSSGKKIRYKYRCTNVNKDNPTEKGTGFQSGDKITSLTKHNVQCSLGKGLVGFGMKTNNKGEYQYDYKCEQPLN